LDADIGPERHPDADANVHPSLDVNLDANAHANVHSDADADTNSDIVLDGNADANTHADIYPDADPDNIDATNSSSVSLPPNITNYFLRGTVVNLYYYQAPAMNLTTQACQVLQQDVSWVFSGGLWRNAPVPVSPQSIVQNFYTNAPNTNTSPWMYPTTVYNDMTNYMGLYVLWGNSGFNPAFRNSVLAASTVLSNDLGLITIHQ
jgi:hypothetical protein